MRGRGHASSVLSYPGKSDPMTSEVTATDLDQAAAAMLRGVGQRVTRPRIVVLSQFIASGQAHVSAEEVLDRVEADDTNVHRATVYRTLEGLTAVGVLCHVHLGRGLTAYHLSETGAASGVRHLHAQCSRCGTVVDLPPHVLGDTAIRIRRSSGFRLDPGHVALSGLCKECAPT
jgi:Fur family ferric uptake transcriptional regulator